MPERFDLIVIGGGIVGLSAAWAALQRFPRLRLAVIEKEDRVAAHQSGHNSGVIHSGLYYKPGTRKARMCVQGAAAMLEFCRENGIPHQVCGKLVLATQAEEVPALRELCERGTANGLRGLRLLSADEARDIEPHCACVLALHVPSTAITDYSAVTRCFARLVTDHGGEIRTRSAAVAISRSPGTTVVRTATADFEAAYVVNCAGLQSDRIMRMAGDQPQMRIVPFRGEYCELTRPELVRGLIYPVPDPRFPFLGVHFTRRIHGGVDAGPNAMFALKREAYSRAAFSLRDAAESVSWPGLWRLAARHWRTQLAELHRSFSAQAFAASLRRMLPELRTSDLRPASSGVRAQALARDGTLVDDFLFHASGNVLHVCNVPSPAATASIPIGHAIVQMMHESFGLDSFREYRHEPV
jgi:L-2-hydroxyglutarate oxidase LhgO